MVSYHSARKLSSCLVRAKLVATGDVKFVITLKGLTLLLEPLQVNHLR